MLRTFLVSAKNASIVDLRDAASRPPFMMLGVTKDSCGCLLRKTAHHPLDGILLKMMTSYHCDPASHHTYGVTGLPAYLAINVT